MTTEYIIIDKKQELFDTVIYTLKAKNGGSVFSFLPGQYCYLTNPSSVSPQEAHPFSIASSPTEKRFLEFCIKTVGDWTGEFSQKKKGDSVYVSDPTGQFVWDPEITHAVFLLGGIGISPVMSMLRFLASSSKKPSSLTMLYGNRTPETVAYKKELETLQKKLPQLRLIHIFSHISDDHPYDGYRGFITQEIVEKEVDLTSSPTFFMVGPPIFIQKMKQILRVLGVEDSQIKEESLEDLHSLQNA